MIKNGIIMLDLNPTTRNSKVNSTETKNSLSSVGLELLLMSQDLLGQLLITSTQMNNLQIILSLEIEP